MMITLNLLKKYLVSLLWKWSKTLFRINE